MEARARISVPSQLDAASGRPAKSPAIRSLDMNPTLAAILCGLALAACQSASKAPAPLGANAIACRDPAIVATLRGAGDRFQRVADGELASGRCRVFQASHSVADKRVDNGLVRFTDPASRTTYWVYPHG
jgi:hypothetical protein